MFHDIIMSKESGTFSLSLQRYIWLIKAGTFGWCQHYVIWLTIYMTSVRPGSITVGYGSEKGADRGEECHRLPTTRRSGGKT